MKKFLGLMLSALVLTTVLGTSVRADVDAPPPPTKGKGAH
jgi:hypothetical protein